MNLDEQIERLQEHDKFVRSRGYWGLARDNGAILASLRELKRLREALNRLAIHMDTPLGDAAAQELAQAVRDMFKEATDGQ